MVPSATFPEAVGLSQCEQKRLGEGLFAHTAVSDQADISDVFRDILLHERPPLLGLFFSGRNTLREHLTDLVAEHPARGSFGQGRNEKNGARALVQREALADIFDDFRLGGRFPVPRDGAGVDFLPLDGVREADDHGFEDAGMGGDDLLDFHGIHGEAAFHDDVLLSGHDETETALLQQGQIAGPEPAVTENLPRGLGAVRIPFITFGP